MLASNFLKYPGAQVFAFDKGRSMTALCLAADGAHYTLGEEGHAIAPLRAIDDLGLGWAQGWIEGLVTLSRQTVTPAMSREITSALQACRTLEGEALAAFHAMVQNEDVKGAVAPYIEDGAYAGLLNGLKDEIAFSPFTVFETEALFETSEAAGLLTIDYLFRRIEARLRGAPTLILLDEAWSYLGHDVFRARIKKWLRELRKANASVVIATQFIGDALDSELAGALLQSCRTRIYLPDPDARSAREAERYAQLGLTEAQIALVSAMKPKRDYYVVKPEGRRVVDFAIQPQALALLGATNTEDSTRAARLAQTEGPGWWRSFIESRLKRLQ
jgi:type IV secretion system protein VirB4